MSVKNSTNIPGNFFLLASRLTEVDLSVPVAAVVVLVAAAVVPVVSVAVVPVAAVVVPVAVVVVSVAAVAVATALRWEEAMGEGGIMVVVAAVRAKKEKL